MRINGCTRTKGKKLTMMPISGRPGFIQMRNILHIIGIMIFCIPATPILFAQDLERSREVRDTVVKMSPINQSLLHSFDPTSMVVPSFREIPAMTPLSLHQSLMTLPLSLSTQFQQQIDVVSPWKQELAKQNEYRTLKSILGAVQVGGTAYLLYEHIRKYGLK
jgi:hypothetical protein